VGVAPQTISDTDLTRARDESLGGGRRVAIRDGERVSGHEIPPRLNGEAMGATVRWRRRIGNDPELTEEFLDHLQI
jgi:hypothetical protein